MNVLYVRRHAQPQMRVLPVPKNLCIDIETFFHRQIKDVVSSMVRHLHQWGPP